MVLKENLREELNSFNKQLEKHLQGVGVDLLEDINLNKSSFSQDDSEAMILLTQSLKDIRMEMNLMRKHLSSDTEVMLKSLMSAQQRQFQDEMRSFQEKTFSILKVFDPSVLKEINSEIGRVSQEQTQINSSISSLGEKLESLSKRDSLLDLRIELEPLFMSLSSKQEKLENHISTLLSQDKNKFENFELILKDTFESLEESVLLKNNNSLNSIIGINSENKKEISYLSSKINSLESEQEDFSKSIESKLTHLRSTLSKNNQKIQLEYSEFGKILSNKMLELESSLLDSDNKLDSVGSKLNTTFDELNVLKKNSNNLENFESGDLDTVLSTRNDESKIIDLEDLKIGGMDVSKSTLKNKEKLLDIDSRLRKLSLLK